MLLTIVSFSSSSSFPVFHLNCGLHNFSPSTFATLAWQLSALFLHPLKRGLGILNNSTSTVNFSYSAVGIILWYNFHHYHQHWYHAWNCLCGKLQTSLHTFSGFLTHQVLWVLRQVLELNSTGLKPANLWKQVLWIINHKESKVCQSSTKMSCIFYGKWQWEKMWRYQPWCGNVFQDHCQAHPNEFCPLWDQYPRWPFLVPVNVLR